MAEERLRSLKLSDAQRTVLLDRLDQQETRSSARNRRVEKRYRFRRVGLHIQLTQPGGGTIDAAVDTRNLSAGGIAFIYNGFLHSGTEVTIDLPRRGGGTDLIEGKILWCRHLVGTLHACGMNFNTRVSPRAYCDANECGLPSEQVANPAELEGSLLVVQDQEVDHALLAFNLRETSLELDQAATACEMHKKIETHAYDLALVDLMLPDQRGEEAMAQVRTSGVMLPWVAFTAEHDPERLRAAQAAGAIGVLKKPYEKGKLLGAIAGLLKTSTGAGVDPPIYSSYNDTPDMGALIDRYVSQAQALAMQLQLGIESNSYDRVRAACQSLKGSGSSYGFKIVTDTADQTVQLLDACKSVRECVEDLQRLRRLCLRLASPVAQAGR